MKAICFVTTGDIKSIATAKRALGMANPLTDLGWRVHIILEDTPENRHRALMECDGRTTMHFLRYVSARDERQKKRALIDEIRPSYIYLCAFVFRNVVPTNFKCIKLVEHSELRSAIRDVPWWRRGMELAMEYGSLLYANGLLNASAYLQRLYSKRARLMLRGSLPMLYLPYAYSKEVCKAGASAAPVKVSKGRGDIFVTYLGSLSRAYRTVDLVKALPLIGQPSVKLLLLGDGDDRQAIESCVTENKLGGQVFMPGYVSEEDIATYFSLTDVFVLPMSDTVQDWARCPSKLYMYLPYGKPIVTARIGEPPTVLGDEGVYYEQGSVQSLAKAIVAATRKGKLGIAPEPHEWAARAAEFDRWINAKFEHRA